MGETINWAALGAPFPPKDVSFRIQTTPKDGQTRALVVAYVDARAVADRLDEICGKDGWSFDWQPILTGTVDGKPAVLAAKGILTIGGVSKADVGDAGDTEPTKASVSDSLKRAAVLWGIGRYLYDMPRMYAETVKHGRSTYLADGEENRLRREYLTPKTSSGSAPHSTHGGNPAAQTQHATPTPSATPAASQHATATPPAPDPRTIVSPATGQQLAAIHKLCNALGRLTPTEPMTYAEARQFISELSDAYGKERQREAAAR